MGFNYGYEKKKFDSRWKRLEVEYCDAGMSEEQIANNMMKYVVNHSCSESLHRYLINGMLIRLIKRDMDGWLRWKTNNYC